MSGHANFNTISGYTALHLQPNPQVEDDIHVGGNQPVGDANGGGIGVGPQDGPQNAQVDAQAESTNALVRHLHGEGQGRRRGKLEAPLQARDVPPGAVFTVAGQGPRRRRLRQGGRGPHAAGEPPRVVRPDHRAGRPPRRQLFRRGGPRGLYRDAEGHRQRRELPRVPQGPAHLRARREHVRPVHGQALQHRAETVWRGSPSGQRQVAGKIRSIDRGKGGKVPEIAELGKVSEEDPDFLHPKAAREMSAAFQYISDGYFTRDFVRAIAKPGWFDEEITLPKAPEGQ